MSFQIQLLATASTLDMYRRGRPGPFEILGLLAYCKSGNASIEISLPDDRLRVTFRFDDGPSGWAESVVRDCAIPAVYSFGRIEFVSHATLLRIDAPQFLQLDPACTVATASQIGKSEQEHLTIEFDRHFSEWLSTPKLETALLKQTWAGAPTDQTRRRVYVKCLANQKVIEQPLLGLHPHKEIAELPQCAGRIVMQATIASRGKRLGAGRVRHMATGSTEPTDGMVNVPEGIMIDLDYDITGHSASVYLSGQRSFQLAKDALKKWTERLIAGQACQRIIQRQARDRVAEALKVLEERRKDLGACEFVTFKGQTVYRAPTNENQLVCLFLKLEALRALPFHCEILEYTPKTGIDAIGHFSLDNTTLLEVYAPVEFEHEFESFVAHGHPAAHTKLIVCWSADQGRGRDLAISPRGHWLRYYSVGDLKIPVIVVKCFPGISTERQNA